jgi:hypothetical protein
MTRLLALALAVLALAACSNDSKDAATTAADATTSTTAVTTDDGARAAYIAEADGVCTAFQQDHPELTRSIRRFQQVDPEDPELLDKAATHFALVLRLARDFSDDFDAVQPPEGDRAAIEELGAANDEALDLLDEIVADLKAGQNPTEMFRTYGETLANADRLARAYGFNVCSRITSGQ